MVNLNVQLFLLSAVPLAILALKPSFPVDWSAREDEVIAIHQGPYSVVDGMLCCPEESNCQVQVQYEGGLRYFDSSHNRTRFDIDGEGIIVSDYVTGKEMAVNVSANGTLTCVDYCPLEDPTLEPLAVGDKAKDAGPVTVGTKTYESWKWNEVILKVIVMEKVEMLVDQSGAVPIPYAQHEELTPFGQDLGTANTTWDNFKPGPQDPALFAVQGVDTCPEASNCGQLSRQLHRLRDRAYNTFLKYHQMKH